MRQKGILDVGIYTDLRTTSSRHEYVDIKTPCTTTSGFDEGELINLETIILDVVRYRNSTSARCWPD